MSEMDTLPVLSEAVFGKEAKPYEWVTFLNRTLKRSGLIFGVTAEESGFRLTIYRADPWPEKESERETADPKAKEKDSER